MSVIALDVGDQSIGVAVSDPTATFALPLCTIKRRSKAEDVTEISRIIEERTIETMVVGLPLDLQGKPGPQAKKVKNFITFLKRRINLPVIFIDERYTTQMAGRAMIAMGIKRGKEKGIEDALAASYILEMYLKKSGDD
ncbi:MAG: Holliday junction resolvase RuvX [Tissierellia bacterium]|nr:Holliday junction resolvase RuvX [Tissierellia bacterium]